MRLRVLRRVCFVSEPGVRQDEGTRVKICDFKPKAVRERKPVCPLKASGFFQELHESLFPEWVCDERQSLDAFIDNVRMCYLVS